ncbi:MAG TPA: exodeoxyribonuclease V subunit gamma [Solirubrobacteraceae bacterium]|nr:exodeoxyribonuclease V subunit gamma [Solirubrobacteraceae bacterium]
MLHIHRATRADALADALAQMLARAPSDPFAPEVVAVPTRGMERWLTQRMSAVLGARPGRGDGVCANVLFPSPHRLVSDAVAVAAEIDAAEDPWLPERAVWPLLDVVDAALGEPWLGALATYLGAATAEPDPVRQARRLAVIGHLATLFDRYALHRPSMLDAWRDGRDTDALGRPLPPACAWQAELWRRLRARIARPDLAQRTGRACARLAQEPGLLDLPERLSLFGLTRLPAGHLRVLRALAAGREVHLFLLHPSPALWEAVAAAGTPPDLRRAVDPTAGLAANRLLASWGRDAREMELVLLAGADRRVDPVGSPPPDAVGSRAPDAVGSPGADQLTLLEAPPEPSASIADHEHPARDPADTLLGLIQADVRADRRPPGTPLPDAPETRRPLDPEDRSIQVHSCHGRARQVEVVRDAILHALADDPTLEPRDVIVMCPDIETFAPLIQATFGAGEPSGDEDGAGPEHRAIDLHVRLADRSLRQTNPVLGVVSALLELAQQRLTASQMLDLADRAPVRRRFGLDDEDITRLQDWIAQAGIRWGLDAGHRAPYRLDTLDSGTWHAGLDRLLLGVTMTEDGQRLFADVLPLDDVDSRSIDLAGRFAELVARVGRAVASLGERQTLNEWAEAIADAADAVTATSPRDRWQRAELQRILDEMVAEAAGSQTPELAPAEMRAHLARRLEGRPTRANFRTGHLTVCTLLPMRSVPHRVVCLLGLDDGAFPRKAPRDGDDLMLTDPHVGERDPRSEDRQLLLDALLAATEQLIVTYTGNDERTNAARPPAVPVGELLDTIDATVHGPDRPAREQVVVRHPLQPFDPRNFIAGEIAGADPWSFDAVALAGADALTRPRTGQRPFLPGALPAPPGQIVELAELVRFLEHPVRAFLRRRLGISLFAADDEIRDQLSVELDHLERWGVGQRLLDARLRGVDARPAILAEIARGTLPPGVLGQPVIRELSPIVSAIVAEAGALAPGASGADPVDVRVGLADGRLLTGTVNGVCGDLLLTTTFSRVSARQRTAAWARLLALTASWPQRPFAAATVGRGPGRDDVRTVELAPLDEGPGQRSAIAREQLQRLVDLYDRGMREPLPLFTRTSAAYAWAAHGGQDPVTAATQEWVTEWNFDREDRDAEHQMAFGGVLAFDAVLELAPRSDESGDGWPVTEPSRFGRLARRLWDELLARERVSSR